MRSSEQLGKYRLLKQLATGGMAEIWLAKQTGVEGFEKLVVIKRILPHLSGNAEFVQMFLDEARLAAQLSHPNIVQIFELGRIEQTYYIAMEYIHGENLRSVTRTTQRKKERIPPHYVAKIVSQACEALYYAHTKSDFGGRPLGIVHRDISPQNLLLSYEGQVKVVDFGIAKAATQMQETRTGVLKGKYAYMSPEQCRGEKLDARSDVFALGIVLWELATGTRLYKRQSELMTLKAITEQDPPPPTEVRHDIPVELEAVTLKALARRTEDRFQSCHEMHMALESFLHARGQPVSPMHLAEYMTGLFPEKLESWKRIVQAQGTGENLESQLFDDVDDLFDGGTPSSKVSSSPGAATKGSGARPLTSFGEDTQHEAPTVSKRPPAQPPPPGPLAAAPPDRRRQVTFALGGAAALVALAWLYLGVIAPHLGKAAPAAAAASAKPAVDASKGILLVDAYPPEARVFIDGEERASETPARIAGLAVGATHRIRVEAHGYQPWVTEVVLDTPGTERRLAAHLVKDDPMVQAAVLAVTTEPSGAEVTVDDTPLSGKTPLKAEVPFGHAGSIVRVTKKGYAPEVQTVDLGPGSHQSIIVQLREASAKTGEAGAGTSAGRSPRHRPAHAALGTLSVSALPWCNISVDGHAEGQTPVTGVKLRAGRHLLVCHNPQTGATRSLHVRVRAGRQTRETIRFGFGHLVVRVKPWAKVTVNGKVIGTTPMSPQKLPEGTYTVVLENPNFSFRRRYKVTITPGKSKTLSENLLR